MVVVDATMVEPLGLFVADNYLKPRCIEMEISNQ